MNIDLDRVYSTALDYVFVVVAIPVAICVIVVWLWAKS